MIPVVVFVVAGFMLCTSWTMLRMYSSNQAQASKREAERYLALCTAVPYTSCVEDLRLLLCMVVVENNNQIR